MDDVLSARTKSNKPAHVYRSPNQKLKYTNKHKRRISLPSVSNSVNKAINPFFQDVLAYLHR